MTFKINSPAKIDEFKDTKKNVNLKKTLHIPQGKNLEDSFLYSTCYAI